MTTRPPDDLHDERFDAAWKRASREAPPRALDDAIRAAARREVGARPQDVAAVREATRPERWWFPLAAAATIGAIAIGVLQLSTPDRLGSSDEQRVVSDTPKDAKEIAPASAPSPAKEAPPIAKREASAAPAAANPTAARQSDEPSARDVRAKAAAAAPPTSAVERANSVERAKPAAPQPFPARDEPRAADQAAAAKQSAKPQAQAPAAAKALPAEGAGSASTSSVEMKSRAEPPSAPVPSNGALAGAIAPPSPPAAAAPMAAPARAAAQLGAQRTDAVEALAKDRAQMSIADWIARMRKLRDERRDDELANELAAFRSLHADADALLPPDLRAIRAPVSR